MTSYVKLANLKQTQKRLQIQLSLNHKQLEWIIDQPWDLVLSLLAPNFVVAAMTKYFELGNTKNWWNVLEFVSAITPI
jgi:hypothetical protein